METFEVIGIRPYWGIEKQSNQEYYKATVFVLDKSEQSTATFNNLSFGSCSNMSIIEFDNRRELDSFITMINGHEFSDAKPLKCEPLIKNTFMGSRVFSKMTGLRIIE